EAYKLSLCIPDACTAKDLNYLLNLNSNTSVINDFGCSTKDSWKAMNTLDYYCITFFVLFTVFIVITTSYDVYCRYQGIGMYRVLFLVEEIINMFFVHYRKPIF
ncbi:hypothetical protein GWI33_009021, partial [Rhynchophorus ferrugineus]